MTYQLFESTQPLIEGSKRLYLMDIDGTIVTSASGRRWASSADDWVFLGPVPQTLQELRFHGWTIALITNQSAWSPIAEAKILSILAALQTANGWAPWCLVATSSRKEHDTVYRKPGRGLYDVLLTRIGSVSVVQMCGDAVGPADPFPPYRWSDSDAAFAATIGATFVRPCDLFGSCLVPTPTEKLVILMGSPGSGKSTTARRLVAAGYVHIEQDAFSSKSAVLKAVKAALAAGSSVVVDATHGSDKNREPYMALAPSRILWHVRDGRPFNALRPAPVPEVAYAIYAKYFVRPAEATLIY
jgi:bifunctional polynucleotide phosphatase/kinase